VHEIMASAALPHATVVAVEVDGIEAVLFRTVSGRVCATQRNCPHLDWDLAEAAVDGEELVCPGHGWSIGSDGRAFKRNEFGREDDKCRVAVWRVVEREGMIYLGESS
jgi:nitrite reductase/ring-hydroxylating ferredoxin subunit